MSENITCYIVDDERFAAERLAAKLNKLYPQISVKGTYYSWEDALHALRKQQPDILFLDISMPEKNGIDLLRLLPEIECEIIFTTAYTEYTQEAIQFFATGYLLKPIDDAKMMACTDKAIERSRHKRMGRQEAPPTSEMKIGIPNRRGINYVNIQDILYLESVNKCTRVVFLHNELISAHNLGTFKKLIEHNAFYPAHRSYIINLNHIVSYQSEGYVVMTDKKEIPISKNLREDFQARFLTITRSDKRS